MSTNQALPLKSTLCTCQRRSSNSGIIIHAHPFPGSSLSGNGRAISEMIGNKARAFFLPVEDPYTPRNPQKEVSRRIGYTGGAAREARRVN